VRINMSVNELSIITGDYYHRVGTINGFEHIQGGLIDRIIGPNALYKADFEDPETQISSEITEWWNLLTVDSYLGSITIRQSGLLVYRANVNQYFYDDHINQRYRRDRGWIGAIVMLTDNYREFVEV